MDKEKTVMLMHLVAGLVAGYLSYIIRSNLYALVIMLFIMLVMKRATDAVTKEKQKPAWWLGNGGFVYIFIWLISWIIFFNLL